jgi:hypothetical protein
MGHGAKGISQDGPVVLTGLSRTRSGQVGSGRGFALFSERSKRAASGDYTTDQRKGQRSTNRHRNSVSHSRCMYSLCSLKQRIPRGSCPARDDDRGSDGAHGNGPHMAARPPSSPGATGCFLWKELHSTRKCPGEHRNKASQSSGRFRTYLLCLCPCFPLFPRRNNWREEANESQNYRDQECRLHRLDRRL